MRIALDISAAMGRRPTGVSRAIRGTLRGLGEVGGEEGFVLCGRASRWRPWRRIPSVSGFRKRLFRDRVTPGLARSVDLFHGLDVRLPPGGGIPMVSTFHDLSALQEERFTSDRFREGRVHQWEDAIQRASRIVTYSDFAREEMGSRLSVPAERVSVVPLGVDPVFRPGGTAPGMPERYLLTVGGMSRRKGTAHLVEALAGLSDPVPLVICGRDGFGAEETVDVIDRLGMEERVIRLGYVPRDETLAALYAGAEAVVLPSLYEGFGLSALEAMGCGTPVVAARAGAIPEVVGDAARLVPAGDPDGLREGIEEILSDAGLRAALTDRGRVRADRFRWERTARGLLEVYRTVLGAT